MVLNLQYMPDRQKKKPQWFLICIIYLGPQSTKFSAPRKHLNVHKWPDRLPNVVAPDSSPLPGLMWPHTTTQHPTV